MSQYPLCACGHHWSNHGGAVGACFFASMSEKGVHCICTKYSPSPLICSTCGHHWGQHTGTTDNPQHTSCQNVRIDHDDDESLFMRCYCVQFASAALGVKQS